MFKQQKLIFLYHDNLIQIKEASPYSTNYNAVYSREFDSKILLAKGYKNRIIAVLKTKLEHVIFSGKSIVTVDENTSYDTSYSFVYPNKGRIPTNVEFLKDGNYIIAAYKTGLDVFSYQFKLLHTHEFNESPSNIIIPDYKGRTYIEWGIRTIHIYKFETSQDIFIETRNQIINLVATKFDNHPHLIYSDSAGMIYLDHEHLENLQTSENFLIHKEFLSFHESRT